MDASPRENRPAHGSRYRDKQEKRPPAVEYTLHYLQTINSGESDAHNDSLLGPDTFGIEIVLDAYRDRCGRGNLDPQHRAGGGSSAIEHAMGIALPGGKVKLVT